MAAAKKVKLLVGGTVVDVPALDKVVSRVNKINGSKHGPFDIFVCFVEAGDGVKDAIASFANGTKKLPLFTIFLPTSDMDIASDTDGVLIPGDKHGVVLPDVARGLRIAYTHSVGDADAVHQSLLDKGLAGKGLDLLLTASWPAGVTRRSKILKALCPTEDCDVAEKATAALVQQLRPRYHFTVSSDMCDGAFCQREPYANAVSDHKCPTKFSASTRFIALSAVGAVPKSGKKMKWLHALSLSPADLVPDAEMTSKPKGCTKCPYDTDDATHRAVRPVKRARSSYEDNGAAAVGVWDSAAAERITKEQKTGAAKFGSQFFYRDAPNRGRRGGSTRQRPDRFERTSGPATQWCWFCLSNPKAEQHLIASVGGATYLCLPKGGLVPGHVLVVPVAHDIPCVAAAKDDTASEIRSYKRSMQRYFRAQKVPQEAVFFERAMVMHGKQMHAHLQILPVSVEQAKGLKDAVLQAGKASRLPADWEVVGSEAEILRRTDFGQTQYLSMELPGDVFLVCILGNGFHRAAINFQREVLAQYLGMPHRANWRSCLEGVDKEVETKTADDFRESFKLHDPFL